MQQRHLRVHKALLTGAMAIALTISSNGNLLGLAQNFGSDGRSGRGTGGGSRGGCPKTPKPLRHLVPEAAGYGGSTVSSHPTFWVYVPYTLKPSSNIEFVLQDEQKQDLYRTKIPGEQVPAGIVSIALPASQVPPLEIGKSYPWFFQVNCIDRTGGVGDRPAFVQGWVKRVAPDSSLTKQMKAASPQQLSRLYADNLIWYDALTTLAQARRAKPNDKSLLADWNKLLGLPSVKLTEFASEYVTPCCALQEPRSR